MSALGEMIRCECLSCFAIFIFFVMFNEIGCNLLSASRVTRCLNDGSEELDCEKKLVVSLSMHRGQGAVESIYVSTAEQDDDTSSSLAYPIHITCQEISSLIVYPITARSVCSTTVFAAEL